MAYYNDFNLLVLDAKDKKQSKEIIDKIVKTSGYDFHDIGENWLYITDVSWENMEKDVASVAKMYPDVIIEVERKGEDIEDEEMTRFRGNEVEPVTKQHLWPRFRTILTGKERKGRKTEGNLYVATVVEVDGNGGVFTSVYDGYDPRKVTDDVRNHLETEAAERGLELTYSKKDIFKEVAAGNAGNDLPLKVEAGNRECIFYIATAVVSLDGKKG